jgi:hypothetical protein
MEISSSPVIVMVIVLFSWARTGKETTVASIMATRILAITVFIFPSESADYLLVMPGQSPSNESPAIKCYNPNHFLSRPPEWSRQPTEYLRLVCQLPSRCLLPGTGYDLRFLAFEVAGVAAIMAAPRAAMI